MKEVSTNNVKGKETYVLKKQLANIKTFKSEQKKKKKNKWTTIQFSKSNIVIKYASMLVKLKLKL